MMATDRVELRIDRRYKIILKLMSEKLNVTITKLISCMVELYLDEYSLSNEKFKTFIDDKIMQEKFKLKDRLYKQNLKKLKTDVTQLQWFWNSLRLLVKVLISDSYCDNQQTQNKINTIIDLQIQLLETYDEKNIYLEEVTKLETFRDLNKLKDFIREKGNLFIVDKKINSIGFSQDNK